MSNIVNIALIQMSCSESDQENYQKTLKYIKNAAEQGAKLYAHKNCSNPDTFARQLTSKFTVKLRFLMKIIPLSLIWESWLKN